MNVNVSVTIQTLQRDARTGEVVKIGQPIRNLVMDGGLNALARSTNATNPAEFASACRVGSGTTPDKVLSGAITFTQSGTTLTASTNFFTAGHVGWIFKYGSGTAGAEYYITAFTSATQVTVDTSATVSTPTVGAVWNVTRTALETLLFTSNTFETTAGSCQTTVSVATRSHKRTFNFAQQGSSYNVNEIGYFRTSTGSTIFGRIVLPATEVVAPTNFLQVVLTVQVEYTPASPTAVGNVGTNIDTSGNAMLEQNNATATSGDGFAIVNSNGSVTNPTDGVSLDGSSSTRIGGAIASYSQNSTPGTGPTITFLQFANSITWTFATTRGKMTASTNSTISTAGQTLFGVGFANTNTPRFCFDIKFTTTYTLPTGSFLPQCVFSCTYNRVLSN